MPADAVLIQGGAVGVLVVFVMAILTGRLVARSVARELVDQARANAAQWQAAAQAEAQRADETQRMLSEVLAALRAVETLVRANHHREIA